MIKKIKIVMVQSSARQVSASTSDETVEKKAIALISWARRHGKPFSKKPLVDLVDNRFVITHKNYYQPAIDFVAKRIRLEAARLHLAA